MPFQIFVMKNSALVKDFFMNLQETTSLWYEGESIEELVRIERKESWLTGAAVCLLVAFWVLPC